EAMPERARDGGALSGGDLERFAGLQAMLGTVDHHPYRRRREAAGLVEVMEFDDQVAAAAHDDVLHLHLVKMERRLLVLADHEELLGVRLLVGNALAAVADTEDDEAALGEAARAEIGDIPAHLVGR